MTELTDQEADNLGRGLAFSQAWDFETRAGSIALRDGLEILGRDLAFALAQELDVERGRLLQPEDKEDILIVVRRIARRDDRVERVAGPIEVEAADDPATAEVTLDVVAATGERGELVLPV